MGCGGGCKSEGGVPARRNQIDEALGAAVAFPGDEKLALDGEFSCVTLYAASNASPLPGLSSFIRINLFAESGSARDLVASVIFPTGFRGMLMRVSGWQVDSWHVTMQATSTKATTKLVIQGDSCCAEPAIVIPEFLQNPSGLEGFPPVSFLEQPSPGPKQGERGLWRIRTEAGANPVVLLEGERVVGLTVRAGVLAATVTIAGKIEVNGIVTVEPGDSWRLDPAALLVGPATITFGGGFLRFVVETVR